MFDPTPTTRPTQPMGGPARQRTGAAAPVRPGRPRRRTWRDAFRDAVDAVVAFATLADLEVGDEPQAPHPHRAPLHVQRAPRRPGAADARPQPCLTPIGRGPAHRRAARPAAPRSHADRRH